MSDLSLPGAVTTTEEARIRAKRKILAHDSEAHDTVAILGLEGIDK